MSIQNETLDVIAQRYTCRAFTDQPVEREKLEALGLAGVQAPSSNNMQGWRIIIINDKQYVDYLDKLSVETVKVTIPQLYERVMSTTGKALYNAPVMVVVATPHSDQYSVEMDSGIVCQNITLAATALGLGTCINRIVSAAFFGQEKEAIYRAIGIPEGYDFSIGILVGYSEYQGAPHKPDAGKISFAENLL